MKPISPEHQAWMRQNLLAVPPFCYLGVQNSDLYVFLKRADFTDAWIRDFAGIALGRDALEMLLNDPLGRAISNAPAFVEPKPDYTVLGCILDQILGESVILADPKSMQAIVRIIVELELIPDNMVGYHEKLGLLVAELVRTSDIEPLTDDDERRSVCVYEDERIILRLNEEVMRLILHSLLHPSNVPPVELTTRQANKLHKILAKAFPSQNQIKQLIYFEVDVIKNKLKYEASLDDLSFEVIIETGAIYAVERLLVGAYIRNQYYWPLRKLIADIINDQVKKSRRSVRSANPPAPPTAG